MLKRLFYNMLWYTCRIGAGLYFNKIEINGKIQLPRNGAIIYAPNHQNAFLDAILIAIFSPQPVTFFTRADIFVKPYIWFLEAMNMVPVLRAKDGFSKVKDNDSTFSLSVDNLLKRKPIMIFPEASHDYPYHLRTLSKGTARVAFDAQLKSTSPIYIVPVGLNYFRRHVPRFKLIMNYGEPINIQDYLDLYQEHSGKALSEVRNAMTIGLKKEMVIPDKKDNYEENAKVFTRENERLTFAELKEKSEKLNFIRETEMDWLKPIILLFSIPNVVPLVLSHYVVSLFEDPVFPGSMKFGIAALFCPLWYFVCFVTIGFFYGLKLSFLIVLGLILFLFLRQELVRYTSPTEHRFITKW